MDKEKIGVAILDVLRKIIDSIHLPTGKILLPTLGFSIAITVISTIVSLVDGAAFVRPLGGLTAADLAAALCFSERSGDNEISRLYSAVRHNADAALRRHKDASALKQDSRVESESGESE